MGGATRCAAQYVICSRFTSQKYVTAFDALVHETHVGIELTRGNTSEVSEPLKAGLEVTLRIGLARIVLSFNWLMRAYCLLLTANWRDVRCFEGDLQLYEALITMVNVA